ncbi:CUB and sushi domain-containing protein 1-like [Scylla paramamosain]|uniref:CUB and sushi domain-containing protein 1-like n=1 Tax=Scylla paramamosain TaxID=85552 RepID=UPI003082E2F9
MTCGSPDKRENTTLSTTDTNTGSTVTYTCPTDSLLVGNSTRTCLKSGLWSGSAPTCKSLSSLSRTCVSLCALRCTFSNSYCPASCSQYLERVRGFVGERECGRRWTLPPACTRGVLPSPPPPHGRVISRGQRSGDTAEYTCEEGYLLTGAKTVSCQLGGAWSDEAAECKFIDCGLPPDLPNGRITLLNHTTHLGSLAKYSCDPNHWLDGPEQRQCGVDAAWSQEEPACVLVTCAKPTLPADGYVTGYSFDVGAEVIYHCNEGYRLETGQDGSPQPSSGHERTRSMKRTCQISGLWSGNVPSCVYTDCGHVPAPLKGSRDYLNGTTYLDSQVNYSCTSNYRIVGQQIRECQEDSQWSGEAPLCQEIRCGPPSEKSGGAKVLGISGSDRRLTSTFARRREHLAMEESYRIGSVASYGCGKGYAILQSPTRKCTENGTWAGHEPACVYVDCGLPDKIVNGYYRLLSNTTYFGSQVSYQCAPDYRLDGRIRRHCLANSTWSGLSPTCVEIRCPDLTSDLTPALEVTPAGPVRSGVTATYSCETGRKIVGNPFRSCSTTGNWNGTRPRCEWVSCQMPKEMKNGRSVPVNETLNYKTVIEVLCFPPFKLLGDFRRVCQENGEWSGEEPRCVGEDDDSIYTILDGNSIDNQASATTTTTAATTTATNTGLYVGLVFGLILCLMFVATLFFLRRRQRRGGGKVQPGGGGGGGGDRPPLPPPNDMKSEVNHSMTYSSITDPTTGNDIYENIDEEDAEEEERRIRGGLGGGGGEEENSYYNYNNNIHNNNYNHYSNITNTTTTTPTTTTTTSTTTPTISHHSQPFYRPNSSVLNSRRPTLPPPQPPTIPPSAVVTINGVTVDSSG